MLLDPRETEIVTLVNRQGGCTVKDLANRFEVTEVTIRRDLRKLEQLNLLKRTHGGAVSLSRGAHISGFAQINGNGSEEPPTDALILAPVQNRAAHTLRERTLRNRIPFLAESVPQEGAIYLGPDNLGASKLLGEWTGHYWLEQNGPERTAYVLDLSQYEYPNTKARSDGFIEGIRSVLGERVQIHSIDAGGLFSHVYQNATTALQIHPEINMIFGVNDDSVLAGIEAYQDLGRDSAHCIAVNVGGEGDTLFNKLAAKTMLKACIALFPEIVGRLAIDAVARLWRGELIDGDIVTPYALITNDNLETYYRRDDRGWEFVADQLPELLDPVWLAPQPMSRGKRVSFVILYRTHEWYQNLARAMQRRASELGISLSVKDLKEDLGDEIRELRRLIGKLATSYVNDGETIILDTGSTTAYMTYFLRERRNLTVITNSMDVLQALQGAPDIRLIATGGEFDAQSRSFVGRGSHLFLDEVRVDKVFLVAGGVSLSFGISSMTLYEAEVRRFMIAAAREVVVMADHTVLDVEANFRVAPLDHIDTLITDAGILARQNLQFTQQGIQVLIAGNVDLRE